MIFNTLAILSLTAIAIYVIYCIVKYKDIYIYDDFEHLEKTVWYKHKHYDIICSFNGFYYDWDTKESSYRAIGFVNGEWSDIIIMEKPQDWEFLKDMNKLAYLIQTEAEKRNYKQGWVDIKMSYKYYSIFDYKLHERPYSYIRVSPKATVLFNGYKWIELQN